MEKRGQKGKENKEKSDITIRVVLNKRSKSCQGR